MTDKVVRSDAEWRAALTPDQYRVCRQAGTEVPFSGAYVADKTAGTYACVCCGQPLFDSSAKYDSGTGWPSFFEPLAAERVNTAPDHSLGRERNEVTCSGCEAHLGHVFDDGPPPSGLRYCMNSVALNLVPAVDRAPDGLDLVKGGAPT